MMRVINLAHGEFLMLGGYAAIVAAGHGVNIWLSMLVVAPVVVGIIGVIIFLLEASAPCNSASGLGAHQPLGARRREFRFPETCQTRVFAPLAPTAA
ncbi:hypothetical protein [Bradyrhizobium erythrophlei]|uniref:hypothetical protein n=1 Tax=Bradyrhizobium erythrophlei TaxID=1437360 RepID=UPI001FD9C35F|nr:hypothetical protein [Bradyrhizobium erythrophlei]